MTKALFSMTQRSKRTEGNARWLVRLTIPEETAQAAGFVVGTPMLITRWNSGLLLRASEKGKVRLPEPNAKLPVHAFEFGALSVQLGGIRVEPTEVPAVPRHGTIEVGLPEVLMPPKREPAVRAEIREAARTRPWVSPLSPLYNADQVLAADAERHGRGGIPVTLEQVKDIVLDAGRELRVLGERHFKLDGANVSTPDLFEVAQRIAARRGQRIVMVV
jgi:hypothetical protein